VTSSLSLSLSPRGLLVRASAGGMDGLPNNRRPVVWNSRGTNEYVKSMVQDLRRLSSCVEHICKQVPANIFKLPKVPVVRGSKSKPTGEDFVKHKFVWHNKRWVCGDCGCFKKGLTGKVDGKSCSSAARAISLAHRSHRLFRGWFGKEASCVPWPFAPFVGVTPVPTWSSSSSSVPPKLVASTKLLFSRD
jgi:hypothetical protein